MDTLPKVLRLCWPELKPIHNEGDGFLQFPNKIVPKEDYPELWIAGLDDKDRVEKILGKEAATIYFNECSQIPYASVLMVLTRLAQKCTRYNGKPLSQRAYYDLNPVLTGHWTHRMFIELRDPDSRERKLLPDPQNYAHDWMNPLDNQENLTPEYLRSLDYMPQRQRIRFYEGKYATEQEGQLWSYELIEKHRLNTLTPEDLLVLDIVRIVIAVDPSGAAGEYDLKADEIGIVVGAITSKGRGLLLEDCSGLYSPEGWARIVKNLYHKWRADRVVGEKNFGGDMVRAIIHGADPNISYKDVTASRGKAVRAEPIAAYYEQGRISHCGSFPVLEDELLNFTTLGYMGTGSPNHADALVWCFTELLGHEIQSGLIEYLKQTSGALEAGEMVIPPRGLPMDKAVVEELGKIATSSLIKPVTSKDTTACPSCNSKAIVRISRQWKCNQCGAQWGEVTSTPHMSRAEALRK